MVIHVLECRHHERNTTQEAVQKAHESKHRIRPDAFLQLRRHCLTTVRTNCVNRIFRVFELDFGVLNYYRVLVRSCFLRGWGFLGRRDRVLGHFRDTL
jgi:hypothetical protein